MLLSDLSIHVLPFTVTALFSNLFPLLIAMVFLFSKFSMVMKDGNKSTSDFNFIAQKYERIFLLFCVRVEKILVILEMTLS